MNWKPVDLVILILTVGIFLVLITPMYLRYVNPEIELSKDALSALIQISIALISIISMYIGAKVNGRK